MYLFFYRLLEPKSAPKKRRVEEQQAPKEPLLPEAPSVSVPQTHHEVLLFPFPPLRTMARNKKRGLLPFGMGGKYSLFLSAGRGRVIFQLRPTERSIILLTIQQNATSSGADLSVFNCRLDHSHAYWSALVAENAPFGEENNCREKEKNAPFGRPTRVWNTV